MKRYLTFILLIGLIGCKHDASSENTDIPLAGTTIGLSNKQMEKRVSKHLKKSTEKILDKLDKASLEDSDWELSRLSVGLFFVLESEFTSVYKLEVEPSVELRFQKL